MTPAVDRCTLGASARPRSRVGTWHARRDRLGQGPTFVRRGRDLVRSEEDDDGVMVLRVGPSRAVTLTEAISCEGRSGDDW